MSRLEEMAKAKEESNRRLCCQGQKLLKELLRIASLIQIEAMNTGKTK